MMTPQHRKKPALRPTRLRFRRRAPAPLPSTPPSPRQPWESMDLSEYDEDLIEMKRRAESDGVHVWIPKWGPTIELPAPIDFGETLSQIVTRTRGREP